MQIFQNLSAHVTGFIQFRLAHFFVTFGLHVSSLASLTLVSFLLHALNRRDHVALPKGESIVMVQF